MSWGAHRGRPPRCIAGQGASVRVMVRGARGGGSVGSGEESLFAISCVALGSNFLLKWCSSPTQSPLTLTSVCSLPESGSLEVEAWARRADELCPRKQPSTKGMWGVVGKPLRLQDGALRLPELAIGAPSARGENRTNEVLPLAASGPHSPPPLSALPS